MMHSSTSHRTSSSNPTHIDPDEKILRDLSTLTDQISLCESILAASSSSSSSSGSDHPNPNNNNDDDDANDALLTVIGYLEACVPRMVELIEAAAQGALSASTFEECLIVNDRLTNVLADVETGGGCGGGGGGGVTTNAPPPAAFPASAATAATTTTMEDDQEEDAVVRGMGGLGVIGYAHSSASGKTTGEEEIDDDFPPSSGLDDGLPAMPDFLSGYDDDPNPPPPSAPYVDSPSLVDNNEDEDFDAFFKDRTSSSSSAK
jgi:hypothetical protein